MMDCPKKELGQITTTINGLWTGKKPPFINIAVIRNTNFSKDCRLKMDDVAMIDVEVKQFASRKLQMGDIIIEKSGGSDKQPVGRPVLFNIPEGDYSFSNFTSTLRVNDQGVILPEYLHKFLYKFYLTGKTAEMQSKTTGLRNLDFNAYKAIKVPVPSIEEQQRIVDELNLLTSIIDKKNAQLRDLDALTQSIFYEMFGDPVINEKGWTSKALGEACSLKAGKGIKASELSEELTTGLYPCFGGNGIRGYIAKKSHKGTYPIIGRQGALCGNVQLASGEFYATEHAVVCTPGKGLQAIYTYYALLAMNLNQYATGVAQPGLAVKSLLPLPIVIPPMELQEVFAERVRGINMQKALLNGSLNQINTLYQSRMAYYFD